MTTLLKEKLHTLRREKRITPTQLRRLLTVVQDPWEAVRGILRGKKIDPIRYQKKMRREWER
jgi:hypothetical protein